MSLLDALLLDRFPFDVWIAYRTDGIKGSGTASDPYDGSPQYASPVVNVTNLSNSGQVATATATNTFSNGDVVTITGATGLAANQWNGTFVIYSVTGSSFSYFMTGVPSASAAGVITARKVSTYRFDDLMNSLMSGSTTAMRIHLGPTLGGLPFLTRGYADSVACWQAKARLKLVGAGIDVTTLRLVGSQVAGNPHFYAIGHALTTGAPAVPNLVDYFEVSDVTIDCNQTFPSGNAVACGAVRVMGNHARVLRIKVINYGTNSVTRSCFAIALLTGDRTAGLAEVAGSGIESCLALQPATSPATGKVTILHAGAKDNAGAMAEAYGRGPFIRNCFVDGGSTSAYGELRGLSMGWCRGGVVEGNQVHNVTYGGPCQDNASTYDIIVRNNYYKNVLQGPFWNLGWLYPSTNAPALSGLAKDASDPSVAVATAGSDLGLQVGERIRVYDVSGNATPPEFKGIFTIVAVVPASFQFKYKMTSVPAQNPTIPYPSVQKVFTLGRAIVERNVVELNQGTAGQIIAIHVADNDSSGVGQMPDYAHGDLIIRDNKVRYLDGTFNSTYVGYGLDVSGAKNLLVRNNVVECVPANPMRNQRCGALTYFNNKTPGGVLVQGWNTDKSSRYDELATDTEDAWLFALLQE